MKKLEPIFVISTHCTDYFAAAINCIWSAVRLCVFACPFCIFLFTSLLLLHFCE